VRSNGEAVEIVRLGSLAASDGAGGSIVAFGRAGGSTGWASLGAGWDGVEKSPEKSGCIV